MERIDPRALETKSFIPLEFKEEEPGTDPVAQAVDALTAQFGDFRTKHEGRIKELEEKSLGGFKDRLDKIEVRLNRPNDRASTENELTPEQKAFIGFLRHGREALSVEEVKSLIVGDDTKGGYLAPPEFVAEVIKELVQYSPVRQAARVGTTSAGSVILPKRTGRPTAHWVGETEERTETESAYGQAEIPVHEAACYVDVSLKLLEDAAVNVEAEVRSDLAEEFGRLEGVAFVNGNGVQKPTGFMQPAGIAYTPNTHATDLKTDALITLMYALPAYYRNRGTWMMNGPTLAAVRKLKDGQGNYLWQPSFQAGQPETILGRPVVEAVDMPDATAGNFPIAFGDFAAYRIYDRVALSVMRDPYTQATKGLVRFHARRRVGGNLTLAEAIRKLKMSTN
jgi:HK97 family phage major capsid protein